MSFIVFLKESLLSEAYIDNVKKNNPDVDNNDIDTYHKEALPKNGDNLLDWVVREHKKGNITPDTAHTIKPYLESYLKNKVLIGDNINKFSVDELRDAVKRFHAKDQSELLTKKENVKTLHEDDDLLVQQHKGWEAAAAMAKLPENNSHYNETNGHAKWCISLRGGANKSYLNTYTSNGKHPVVTIANKHSGRKYALVMNPTSSLPEFRDELDYRPDNSKFLAENPSILDTKVGDYLAHHFSDIRDFKDKLKGKKLKDLSSDDITKLYHDNADDRNFQSMLINHPKTSPDLLVHDYKNHTPNWTADGIFSLSNKNFPKEFLNTEVDRALVDGHRLPELARYANLSKEHITKMLDKGVANEILNNKNIKLDRSHIDKLLKKGGVSPSLIIGRLDNPDDIRNVYNAHVVKGEGRIRNKLARSLGNNPHTPSDVLGRDLQNNHEGMSSSELTAIINHKNFNTKSVHEMFKEMAKNNKSLVLDYHSFKNMKLDQPTQDAIANHYLKDDDSKIYNLLDNKSLTTKTANHVYENWRGGENNSTSSIFSNQGMDKLSDENIKHMLDNADEYHKRDITSSILRNVDFSKRPHLFDAIDIKNSTPFSGATNNTLKSDMIDKLRNANKWDDVALLRHPNTPDHILKDIFDKEKSNKNSVTERPNLSNDLTDHILKTSLEPYGYHAPIIKSLIHNETTPDRTYGKVLDMIGKNGGNSEYKKDLLHEMSKHIDKMSNRTYNRLVNQPLHEKTFNDLLKNGNLNGEQLHNMVINNKKHFFENHAIEKNGNFVYNQNNDILNRVLNHPSLQTKTLDHMISNHKGDKYIDNDNLNYAHRLLQEKQGQLSLPIKYKKRI